MTELVPRLIDLARRAKAHDLNFTVDAEEADRLELSLEVIAAGFADASLKGWDGFGLAIQAYQKRAGAVIDCADDLARALDRRMMVRLVKGAYWDTEIKRAQERGLDNYPVFTRKAMTDLNYIANAQRLLALRPRLFPQFATHNALTVATVLELAGGESGFEFQRLHGMGEALYDRLSEDRPELAYRTYAPVGSHRDLLAYLVRRLLENGANSSFVAVAADDSVPVATLLRRPAEIVGSAESARHPNIRLPRDLYQPQRRNSRGIEFGERAALSELLSEIAAETAPVAAAALINGETRKGARKFWRTLLICWSNGERISSRCCNARAARRSMTRYQKSARPPISAATMPPRGENCSAKARPCRDRPARATCYSCAAAACSLQSRRGIFRWRFSPAKSRQR
jgi:RHH-type proline utilization regulon transcriptional repressor/proline dehydrogenase/delta 1-pyrroline-5-carboxylate dehydrogenase